MQSYLLEGIDARPCEVEVGSDDGIDTRSIVVGPTVAGVNESAERIRTALVNSGYSYPHGRVLISLATADVRKEGPVFDLAIAVALLIGQGLIALAALAKSKGHARHRRARRERQRSGGGDRY